MNARVGGGRDPLVELVRLPDVFEAVEAARGAVDALLREPRLRRRHDPQVSAAALRRGAWASAVLDGWPGPFESFAPPFPEDDFGRLAAASLRTSSEVADVAAVWRRSPLQALARLHLLAASGRVPDEALGRPRGSAAAARLDGLAAMLAAGTEAPAVVVAAVVHGEVLGLDAFGVGSGLVARAAERAVLVDRALDPRAVTAPEAGHLELGALEYAAALAGYRSGTPEGVGRWLVHCAQALAIGARIGREACAALDAADAAGPAAVT